MADRGRLQHPERPRWRRAQLPPTERPDGSISAPGARSDRLHATSRGSVETIVRTGVVRRSRTVRVAGSGQRWATPISRHPRGDRQCRVTARHIDAYRVEERADRASASGSNGRSNAATAAVRHSDRGDACRNLDRPAKAAECHDQELAIRPPAHDEALIFWLAQSRDADAEARSHVARRSRAGGPAPDSRLASSCGIATTA